MQIHPVRVAPQVDLRATLEALLHQYGVGAAFVLQAIGSLSVAQLRLAGAEHPVELRADLEILTLAGSLSQDGAHLHIAVADAQGRITGGHLCPGSIVRTTAEVLVALLPDHRFTREDDAVTGFKELAIGRPSTA
jgi:predicted DNA-binding protein with PD1-like motif